MHRKVHGRRDTDKSDTGVTIDTWGRLIRNTVLNPVVTLPLILLARYTQQGGAVAADHAAAFKRIKTLLYLGLAQRIAERLGDAVINNFSSDKYDWKKEVVVVTGGSDGIGAIVVKLLAEKGIKVAVLDVQPLTYEGTDLPIHTSLLRTGLGNHEHIS